MPYENVVITNNMAYGAAWNGIAITVARNVKITGNTLYPSCHPENGKMLNTWVMTGRVEDLTLADNVAADFLERAPNIRKTQYNNRKSGCLDHSPG
jgi:parallel beta-helix repeat protein